MHLLPSSNGKANIAIIDLIGCIVSILKSCDINIIYISTDGDPSYNYINEMSFDIYMESSFAGGFDAALEAWEKYKKVKVIGDMLHALKIARSRLLIGCITLNRTGIFHSFNASSLEDILLLGSTLRDYSSISKMKDFYALDLFNFKNLEELFKKDLYYELLYLLPFTCWCEAATNANLSRDARVKLLKISFDIFYGFFFRKCFCSLFKWDHDI